MTASSNLFLAAIVFLTDAARVSDEEMQKTKVVLEKYCIKLTMVSIFILYSNDGLCTQNLGYPNFISYSTFFSSNTHTHTHYVLAIFPRQLYNFYQAIVDGVFDGSIDVGFNPLIFLLLFFLIRRALHIFHVCRTSFRSTREEI